MSLFKTIEMFFGKAESEVTTALSTVEAGFKTVDTALGVVLGQVEVAGEVATMFDPPLGAAITTGAAAATSLKGTIEEAIASGTSGEAAIGKQVVQLTSMVTTLGAQISPFYAVAAKDVADVSASAVAAAKAIAPITAAKAA